jgi:hypothetical protein
VAIMIKRGPIPGSSPGQQVGQGGDGRTLKNCAL